MDIRRKQEYVKSWGALNDEIIEKEIARLIDDGYAVQRDVVWHNASPFNMCPRNDISIGKMS
jgi:hypothetical protein